MKDLLTAAQARELSAGYVKGQEKRFSFEVVLPEILEIIRKEARKNSAGFNFYLDCALDERPNRWDKYHSISDETWSKVNSKLEELGYKVVTMVGSIKSNRLNFVYWGQNR